MTVSLLKFKNERFGEELDVDFFKFSASVIKENTFATIRQEIIYNLQGLQLIFSRFDKFSSK